MFADVNKIAGFHMTSHDVQEQLKTNIQTDFCSEWVLRFVIENA